MTGKYIVRKDERHDILHHWDSGGHHSADYQSGYPVGRKDQILTETQRKYRHFLLGVMSYYITDLLKAGSGYC